MPTQTLRIATRKSPLALWQAEHIKNELLKHWPELTIELVPMTTAGDRFLKDKLIEAGGKGLFVKELEEALLDGRADLAVHSMKDVPAHFPEGLGLVAITQRANPQDALISAKGIQLHKLPQGAKIGTSSLRRQSQLLALRPDLIMTTLRGNVQTRLKKMAELQLDGIILARAGLERLELDHLITETLAIEDLLPACGQGALGIECRLEDASLIKLLAPLQDEQSFLCVQTERRVNAQLGGNCQVPLAVYCHKQAADQLHLHARVLNADGSLCIEEQLQAPLDQAQAMADHCAERLMDKGAKALLTGSSS